MINELDIKYKFDKMKIFKKLHIDENTEAYKSADCVFFELYDIINKNIELNALYSIVDRFDLGYKELDRYEKYVLCVVSARSDLSTVINEMMSSGEYLKGYLLNEMITDYIFSASNEMNKVIKEQANKLGYKLSKRFAPGEGDFDFKILENIIDYLKKEVDIKVYLTENYMIVPEKSLVYLFGFEQGVCSINESLTEHGCITCTNLNCEYREIE